MNYDIRPAELADMGLVRETSCKVRWPRRTLNPSAPRATQRYVHDQNWQEWEALHGPTVDMWVADGVCLVGEADGVLLGFAIVTPGDVVRMVYVKRDFRGVGIGLALLAAAGCVPPFVAHLPTPSWFAWAHRIGRKAA